MGVSEGVVNPTAVNEAESAKVKAIQDVSTKKSTLDRTDDFITEMERGLSSGIDQLQEAESSRDSALEQIATETITPKKEEVVPPQPTVQTETAPVVDGSQATVDQTLSSVIEPPKDEVVITEVSQNVEQLSEVKNEVPIEVVQKDVEVNKVQEPTPTVQKMTDKEALAAIGEPQPLSPEAQERKDRLAKFDQSLSSFMNKALSFHNSGQSKAAEEARQICTKLINAKDAYIHQKDGMDEDKLIETCKESTSHQNTKELSNSRGIMGALRRMVQAVKDAVSGVSTLEEGNKTSMERIQDIRDSLKELKNLKKEVEPEATAELDNDRPGIGQSM